MPKSSASKEKDTVEQELLARELRSRTFQSDLIHNPHKALAEAQNNPGGFAAVLNKVKDLFAAKNKSIDSYGTPPLAPKMLSRITNKDFPGATFEPLFIPAPSVISDQTTVCEYNGKKFVPNPKYIGEGAKAKLKITPEGATLDTKALKPTYRWPTEKSTPQFDAYKLDQERLLQRNVKDRVFTQEQGKLAVAELSGQKSQVMEAILRDPQLGKDTALLQAFGFKDRPEVLLVRDKKGNKFLAGINPDGQVEVKEFLPDVEKSLQARAFSKLLDPKEAKKLTIPIEEIEQATLAYS